MDPQQPELQAPHRALPHQPPRQPEPQELHRMDPQQPALKAPHQALPHQPPRQPEPQEPHRMDPQQPAQRGPHQALPRQPPRQPEPQEHRRDLPREPQARRPRPAFGPAVRDSRKDRHPLGAVRQGRPLQQLAEPELPQARLPFPHRRQTDRWHREGVV